jgi:hypothetical protein
MEASSEPTQVRASDAEREAIVARLNAATGEGRLTLEEFGDRAERAYAARTQGELEQLVDDLPARASAPSSSVVPASTSRAASQTIPLGALKRSGRWRLDRDTHLGTVIGAVKLDLRRVEISAAEIELRVETVIGSVKIWIPRGVRVEVEGDTVIGSRQVHEDDARDHPNAPLLRLRIDTVIGTVKVYRV